jgi:hypothetical protein
VAVFASMALVVVAALTIGIIEAVEHLGRDRSILVITDGILDPSATAQTTPATGTVTAENSGLYPVCVDAKWGYIDNTGAIKIAPRFDAAADFSEGLALVGVGITEDNIGKWGYIDTSGTVVIEPRFDLAGDFSEGLAAVGIGLQESGLIGPNGYIDTSGAVVIPLQYEEASSFSEGLGLVRDADGSRYFIDTTGATVLGPYDEARPFSEGLAGVEVGGKRGFIAKNGDWVAVAELATGEAGAGVNVFSGFSEGLAAVETSAVPPLIGYVDTTGAWVIEPRFRYAGRFSGGLPASVMVGASPRKYGYIDTTGAWIIQPQFDGASEFSEGLAVCTSVTWRRASRGVPADWATSTRPERS